MHPRLILLGLVSSLLISAPVLAAPVYVTPRFESGAAPADVAVVAFSYDVRRIFPEVDQRFAQWRPQLPAGVSKNVRQLPRVPLWKDFHLLHATQLQEYREAFAKAHNDEKDMLKVLMPRFDVVFRKFGEKGVDQTPSDVLASEDSRKVWCQKVTVELNAIIDAYNGANGVGDGSNSTYRQLYARWLGKRNEALRLAAVRAGGNPTLDYIESSTTDGGLAIFDLPPGRWYFVCQAEQYNWYKPVIIPAGGGRVMLRPEESLKQELDLAGWTGN